MEKEIQNFLGNKDFTVTPLLGDASNRLYYRIKSKKTYILMKSESKLVNQNFVHIQSILKNSKINVPKIFFESKKIFILEDLSDTTLEKFILTKKQDSTINMYKKAIYQLIKIQKIKPKLKFAFDKKKLFTELVFFKKHFFSDSHSASRLLNRHFLSLSEKLDHQNHTSCFCHRDFHSRNILVQNNEPYLIDFQDAMVGIPQYDLVSLLKDSYTNIDFENLLVEYYLKNSDFEFNKDEFFEIYHLQIIQRSLKACGSFKSFETLKQNKNYLCYIPVALDFALTSLERFKEYREFRDIILDLRESL